MIRRDYPRVEALIMRDLGCGLISNNSGQKYLFTGVQLYGYNVCEHKIPAISDSLLIM